MAETYSGVQSPHLMHRQRSQNSILQKDDVGRAKPSGRSLPPAEHAYGISESWSTGGEGAREALTWAAHIPSPPRRPEADFQRLNKAAAVNQATTPKMLAQFRSSHGDFPRLPPESRNSPMVIPSDVFPSFAYGKRSRPSTPIKSVLANDPGNQCEEALEQRYQRYDEHRKACGGPLKIKLTKAAGSQRKHEAEQPTDPMKLWKMSKFNKIHPHMKQEAPLYRDQEGRLRRCHSCSPMMKTSLSLPSLPVSPGTSSEGKQIDADFLNLQATPKNTSEERQADADALYCDEVDDEARTETEVSWPPFHGSPGSRVASDGVDEPQDVCTPDIEEQSATPALEETLDAWEMRQAEQDVPTAKSSRCQTPVSVFFTVRHAFQRELKIVMSTIQGSIRTHYSDSVVEVREFVVEDAKQSLREKQKRYVAWGQDALKIASEEVDGVKPSALTPLQLMLLVTHTSPGELKSIVTSLVDQICSCFPSSILHVRGVSPPLWAASPRPQPKRHPRDGLGRPLPIA